ncbi:trehalose-phosphatase [Acidothermaceae bacterium B102]|nr:trehalose-phosphatase [Acidothermaceae bacterium B102]
MPALAASAPAPRTPEGGAGLTAVLRDPFRAIVALDFDGTLAPIVDRPEDSRPAEGALAALARVASEVGSVVIITGRSAATVVALAGLDQAPGLGSLVVLGQYGAERWDASTGVTRPAAQPPGLEQARSELFGLITAPHIQVGVEVEDKGVALAVHFRRTVDPVEAAASLRAGIDDLAARTGLVVEPGRMVLELRAPGVDKGSALRRFVVERDARSVLFAGDDLGDLAAFDAVRGLRDVGVAGVTVFAASSETSALGEAADVVVDGPAGMVALLSWLAEMITKD